MASLLASAAMDAAGFNASYTYRNDARLDTVTMTTSAGTSTSTYAYPTSGRVHAATSVATTGVGGGTTGLGWNANGQLTSQAVSPSGGGTTSSSYAWTAAGDLASVNTSGSGVTRNITGPGNQRLARVDPDGSTTVFLGATELKITSGTVVATRYYASGGSTVAMRKAGTGPGAGLSWLGADVQGSAQVSVASGTGTATRAYYTPYGAPRAGSALLAGTEHGFLGKTHDPTGLTQVGARTYNPALGIFISPDPILNPAGTQTTNPYTYAAANPIVYTDPTGLTTCHIMASYRGTCGIGAPPDTTDSGGTSTGSSGSGGGATSTGSSGSGGGSGSTGASSNGNGGTPTTAQPEEHHGWFSRVKSFVVEHKAIIVEVTTNVVVTGGCLLATGGTGSVGCAMAGSAAGTLARSAVTGDPVTLQSMAFSVLLGAIPGGKAARATAEVAEAVTKDVVQEAVEAGTIQSLKKSGTVLKESAAMACSFAGATLVLMADGSKKPIQEIHVGDRVIATDPETGEQQAKPVTAVIVHQDEVTDLVVDGQTITTTEDHPFWSSTDQRFERADELTVGENVLSAEGREVTVAGFKVGTTPQRSPTTSRFKGFTPITSAQRKFLSTTRALERPQREDPSRSASDRTTRRSRKWGVPSRMVAWLPADRLDGLRPLS